ncbi:NAD(P)H-dependent oxidoreductase subunit E [Streptomyces acidicola]|uniref:NAD(P)H-dependent oxidoreductase subunit E n=1 Tax=Streptomyces acidicola TaxID=2596892 RepID=UPI00378C9350
MPTAVPRSRKTLLPRVGSGCRWRLRPAAALGRAGYYAAFAAHHGRRHVRVCEAVACFAAQAGRDLSDVEQGPGFTGGTASPHGEVSSQAVRCLEVLLRGSRRARR